VSRYGGEPNVDETGVAGAPVVVGQVVRRRDDGRWAPYSGPPRPGLGIALSGAGEGGPLVVRTAGEAPALFGSGGRPAP
jgi:hypothetical protein